MVALIPIMCETLENVVQEAQLIFELLRQEGLRVLLKSRCVEGVGAHK